MHEALVKAGRTDLIGFDKNCLIRPRKNYGSSISNDRRNNKNTINNVSNKNKNKKKTIRNVHKNKHN